MISLSRKQVDVITFPDEQPHVRLPLMEEGSIVNLRWPIRNPTELFELLAVSNALDGMFAVKNILYVPYLMGARSDRHMVPGDSCDLRVVADAINSCGWARVKLFDVHSDAALQLINHSSSQDNRALLRLYDRPDAVLVVPDAGELKRLDQRLKYLPTVVEHVICTKSRDLSTGRITLHVQEPFRCRGKNCVVIDDLCDGGATFTEIASQIDPVHATLIVSHGIFSKGLAGLLSRFSHIITSDSYPANLDNYFARVTVVSVEFD